MTPLWTSADAAAATGGKVTQDFVATGISIDTRSLQSGDLFVALKDVRDGHDFVADALKKGASAALVSHVPEGCSTADPLLLVDDVLPALEALGDAGRARARARVVAVTGSVGKTSTKDMLRTVLAAQGKVHAAEASFNNHWGVPITLARLPQDADFAVIEIGMNHPGEIAPLARMARPHVALITTVGAAHLEAFENLDGIAHEKASIFEGLEPGGTAILPVDLSVTPILESWAKKYADQIVRFGTGRADYQLKDVQLSHDATIVQAEHAGQKLLFKVQTAGRHFAMNALAVLAVAEALGADTAVAACDIGQWIPPAGRGAREQIVLDIVDDHLAIDLIDDAFNANPTSMAAALDVLGAASPRNDLGRVSEGRRIAILGDMLELGPNEAQLHVEIADHPMMPKIHKLHCVGPRMRDLWEIVPPNQRGEWYETASEMTARAHNLVDAGDVVLVKGSKGSKVSLVVDAIRKLGHPGAGDNQGTR